MTIEIEISNNLVKIFLKDKNNVLDKIEFPEEHNISEKLLPELDRILKRNRLEPKDIKKAELKTDIGESFTTYRIAKAIVESFNWSVRKSD